MKKTLLLASVACLISATSANAMNSGMKPYIGADYAYDNLGLHSMADGVSKNFNSAKLNAGIEIGHNLDLEAFYQFGGSESSNVMGHDKKFKFNAYGLDIYGLMPLGCAQKFSLLATAGVAVYDTQLKHYDKTEKSKVGYRVGGGAEYKMTDNFSTRVVGRYGYIGSRDLNHVAEVTAGLKYAF